MIAQRRLRWSLLALVGFTATWLSPSTGRADIILSIVPIQGFESGVLACVDQQCAFAPSTNNPAHALFGTVESALAQFGSSMQFLFAAQGTFGQNQFASTAPAPAFANPLQIAIVGTAGEPVGTPVSLQLSSVTDGDPDDAEVVSNAINDTDYGPNADQLITGFKVGDSFEYWGLVNVLGINPVTLQVELSVQAVGDVPVPEPGALALLMTAVFALGAASRLKDRRRSQVRSTYHGRRQRSPTSLNTATA